jgi:hypothetical protein
MRSVHSRLAPDLNPPHRTHTLNVNHLLTQREFFPALRESQMVNFFTVGFRNTDGE